MPHSSKSAFDCKLDRLIAERELDICSFLNSGSPDSPPVKIYSDEEIAQFCGVPKSKIIKIKNSALFKLKVYLHDYRRH